MTAPAAWCVPVRKVRCALKWTPVTHVKGCNVNTGQTSARGLASVWVSGRSTQALSFVIAWMREFVSVLTKYPVSFLQLMREPFAFWMVPSIRTARSSSPAASTNACAAMGRLAACRAAPWMWCCPGPTAPCHAGSRCPESAARSGCASPRLRPVRWVVLPWRVSRLDVGWDGMRRTAYRDTTIHSSLTLVSLQCETQSWEVMYMSLTWLRRGSRKQRKEELKEGLRKGEETWRKETALSVQSGMWNSDVIHHSVVWIKDHFSDKFSQNLLSSFCYIWVNELIDDGLFISPLTPLSIFFFSLSSGGNCQIWQLRRQPELHWADHRVGRLLSNLRHGGVHEGHQ